MSSKCDMFAEFLSNRIREYNAFGVWMHAHKDLGDDTHHLFNILAFGIENFNRAMKYSDISSGSGGSTRKPAPLRMLYGKWSKMLKLTMQEETITPRIDGISKDVKMFRFFELKTGMSTVTEPDMVQSLILYCAYFITCINLDNLICRSFQ